VAEYVDDAIRRVMDSGSVVETHKAAILAALQITSELFAERAARDALDTEMRGLCSDVMRLLPPAKRASDGVETASAD
jgi:cell division protein ZapA